MANSSGLRALLLTDEPSSVSSFTSVCNELGIEARPSSKIGDISRELQEEKYSAVVIDFDTAESEESYLPALQQSPMNRTAVIVAVATTAKHLQRALECRAHFVLRRPFETTELRRTLRGAYDFMISDRRRQFRCSIVLPVRLTVVRTGAMLECSTVNVSSKGVALFGSMQLKPAEMVDLEMVLPDGFAVLATGIVVWDDRHGKCGVHLQCRTPEIREKLDAWLAAQADSLAQGELSCRDFSEILPQSRNMQ